MMSLARCSFCGATKRRGAVALGAMTLVALLITTGNAQARDVYCASDNEASNLKGGFNEQITGSFTEMFKDSESSTGKWEVIWSGPITKCDDEAVDGCVFRHERGESYTKTTVKGFSAGLAGTGGTVPVPFPAGMFNFSTQSTKTESWNIVNQTSTRAGEQKRPVAKHEWINVGGHYTGAYKYVGEQKDCHAYVLDPNHSFGHWKAVISGDTVQTWDPA